MLRWFGVGCVVGMVVLLGGCGSQFKFTKVSGTVVLDGQPMKEGDITFANSAGLPPDVLPVRDGKFEGLAKQGKVKVEVRAYKDPPKPERPMTEESKLTPVNYLPARFNTATTLTAEVTDSGLNPSKFDVASE